MNNFLLSVSVLWLWVHWSSGHPLSKIELTPTDLVYKVTESKDGKSLTISSPNQKKPTLREIIYYHIIEKPLGDTEDSSDEEEPPADETPADSGESHHAFTNGQGLQYLQEDDENDVSENAPVQRRKREIFYADAEHTPPPFILSSVIQRLSGYAKKISSSIFKPHYEAAVISNSNEDSDEDSSSDSSESQSNSDESDSNSSSEEISREGDIVSVSDENESTSKSENSDGDSGSAADVNGESEDKKSDCEEGNNESAVSISKSEERNSSSGKDISIPQEKDSVSESNTSEASNNISRESSNDFGISDSQKNLGDNNNKEEKTVNNIAANEINKYSQILNDLHDIFVKENTATVLSKPKEDTEYNFDATSRLLDHILSAVMNNSKALRTGVQIENKGSNNSNKVNVLEGIFAKVIKNKIVINNNVPADSNKSSGINNRNSHGLIETPDFHTPDEILPIKDDADTKENTTSSPDESKNIDEVSGINDHESSDKEGENDNDSKTTIHTENTDRSRETDDHKTEESHEKSDNEEEVNKIPLNEPKNIDDVSSINDHERSDKEGDNDNDNKTTINTENTDRSRETDDHKTEESHEKSDKEEAVNKTPVADQTETPNEVTIIPAKEPKEEKSQNKEKSEAQNNSKIDYALDLINNEKFLAFMGNLSAKYLESFSERTTKFIKDEVAAQVSKYFEEHPIMNKEPVINSEKDPAENKFDIKDKTINEANSIEKPHKDTSVHIKANTVYGISEGNGKVTNVYIFNARKNIDDIMKNIKNLVNGENLTNVFAFEPHDTIPSHVEGKKTHVTNKDKGKVTEVATETSVSSDVTGETKTGSKKQGSDNNTESNMHVTDPMVENPDINVNRDDSGKGSSKETNQEYINEELSDTTKNNTDSTPTFEDIAAKKDIANSANAETVTDKISKKPKGHNGEPKENTEEPKDNPEETKDNSGEKSNSSEDKGNSREPKDKSGEQKDHSGEPKDNLEQPKDNTDKPKDNPVEPKDNFGEKNHSSEDKGNLKEPKDKSGEHKDHSGEPKENSREPKGNTEVPKDNPEEPKDNFGEKNNSNEDKSNSKEPKDNSGEHKDHSGEPNDSSGEPKDKTEEPKDNPEEPKGNSGEKSNSGEDKGNSKEPEDKSGEHKVHSGEPKDNSGDPKDSEEDKDSLERHASAENKVVSAEKVASGEKVASSNNAVSTAESTETKAASGEKVADSK